MNPNTSFAHDSEEAYGRKKGQFFLVNQVLAITCGESGILESLSLDRNHYLYNHQPRENKLQNSCWIENQRYNYHTEELQRRAWNIVQSMGLGKMPLENRTYLEK